MVVVASQMIADPIANVPAATVACFDPTRGPLPRRSLDTDRTKQFLEKLAAANVPAVLIAASTGHGHLRTIAELEEWLEVAAQANLTETSLAALLRPEDGLEQNERLLRRVSELGYPLVYFRPGTNLLPHSSDEEVAAQLQPLVAQAAELNLAVGLYSIPDVSGLPLTPQAAAQVVSGPGGQNVVAIKVTEANYETSTRAFLSHPKLQRLKIVQGWDPHLARALHEGPSFSTDGRQRCGVTSGPMSLAVWQYLHILAAAERADWEEVALSQQAVTALFAAMQDDPGKFADLQRAKFIMGLGQPLVAEVTDAQVARVLTALDELPRQEDRQRLARSLDLMEDGPFHQRLCELAK